jgi:polyisoprenoid-binding protein YceI
MKFWPTPPALLTLATLALPAVSLAQTAPDANPADVKAGTYQVETTHTRLLFAVSHLGFSTWYGQFTGVSGTLTIDPKNLAATALDISIPANTVTTTNTKLDGELNSAAWFDTAKYPTITFKSTGATRTGTDSADVTGELSFHGVSRPETLHVTFNASGVNFLSKQYTIGFNATGALHRSDFKQSTYVPLIGDDVSLIISAAFVKP